ncbi:MAG: translation initiation factor [Cyanobacteria bacterium 0813]|nr:translation initiation factor [Cyanobacteria bacterium 0813]
MVDGFLRKLKDAIVGPDGEQVDPDGSYQDASNPGEYGNVTPASQDPYGDPAEYGEYGNVTPASEDPYGDPADYAANDYGKFGNVTPASEDP